MRYTFLVVLLVALVALALTVPAYAVDMNKYYYITPSDLAEGKTEFSKPHGIGSNPFGYDWDANPPNVISEGATGFGNSCFYADVDGSLPDETGRYCAFRFGLRDIFGKKVKIEDLESLSYYTKKMLGDSDHDWFVSVYTVPQGAGDSSSWYRSRVQAYPQNTSNGWIQWNTSGDTNVLQWVDLRRGLGGNWSWEDIKNGQTSRNYSDEEIMYINIQLGYNNGPKVKSYLDGVVVKLTTGETAYIDLGDELPVVYVDDDYTQSDPAKGEFKTIQEAVNAVASGYRIQIAPGTYTEQVIINGKNIVITGSGSDTIIKSPATLNGYTIGSNTNKPVVYVTNANVSISNLVVDGDGKGNANHRFFGIIYHNAQGLVRNCDIRNVQDTPFSGVQHCVGLAVYNTDGIERVFTLDSCHLYDNQKNCTVFSGEGLFVNITNNKIYGIGPTSVTAQNGIQISYGAEGIVTGNEVKGFYYTGPNWGASAILIYDGSVVAVSGNNVSLSNYGLYIQTGSDADVKFNNFVGNDWGVISDSTGAVDATENWWGQPTGASPSGYGDYVYDYKSPGTMTFGDPLPIPATANALYLEPTAESIIVNPNYNNTVEVLLKQANLLDPVNGYQAFLQFDESKLAYVSTDYTDSPYEMKIDPQQDGANINLASGTITATADNASLAKITFTALNEGVTQITFREDVYPPSRFTYYNYELGREVDVIPSLVNSCNIIIDGTPPTLTVPADVTIEYDSSYAYPSSKTAPDYTGTATATDNLDLAPVVTYADEVQSGCGPCYTINRTWKAVDNAGNESVRVQTISVVDTTAPVLTVPGSIIVSADARVNGAFVTIGTATATDNSDLEIIIEGTRDDGRDISDTYYPVGTTTITWTATDQCDNTSTASQTVTVRDTAEMEVTVVLDGNFGTDSEFTRPITFVLGGDGNGPVAPETRTLNVEFVNGVGTVTLDVPANGYWTKISAKDEKHTLRKKVDIDKVGKKYQATLHLTSGDVTNDNMIDILDFAVFAGQYGSSPSSTSTRNADFDGNGTVGIEDFTPIANNFLKVGEAEPTNTVATLSAAPPANGSASVKARKAVEAANIGLSNVVSIAPAPRTAVSVRELKSLGIENAELADMNKDGIVNATDIMLFMNTFGNMGKK
ncbi:MAG TPA: pectinesterase family protein [Armatimonadota bacterium]|nr:pectinesterase family protein [Armatimonadota bacterium]